MGRRTWCIPAAWVPVVDYGGTMTAACAITRTSHSPGCLTCRNTIFVYNLPFHNRAHSAAAPEQSGLDYEAESSYVTRALHDHVGIVLIESGEFHDLVRGLYGKAASLSELFPGYGRAGHLAFEDEFGGAHSVSVEKMLNTIRRIALERLPRFFYLSCCQGDNAPALSGDEANIKSSLPAQATALYREGVAQVAAY